MAVFLIRHGESEGNVKQFFQGQRDVPLTETGRAQAEALGGWLAAQGFQFERVIASPLSRARITAEIVCQHLKRPGPELDPDIREYAAGALEGLTLQEIAERFPDYSQRGLGLRGDFATYGGESYDDVQARLKRFIARMQDLPRERDHAVVLHGGCMYQLLKQWCGWPTPRHFFMRLTNCCLLKLVVRDVESITVGELQWFLPLELATSLAPTQTYVEV